MVDTFNYEPKLSLQFKKDLKNLEKKKTSSYSKNKSSSIDGGEGGIRTHVPVKANAFRVISNQLNFSEVSGTCGNLKEVKTLVISRFFSSKKPQTPLYTTIFYIHINYIDFAHFWELIGNSLGKTFITYY